MRGRKPVPTAIKQLHGNPGKRPLNLNEPKPAVALPSCPAHLSPSARAEWKRLARYMHDLGMISELDRAALAAYCQAWGRWVEAERRLKETPPLIRYLFSRFRAADFGENQRQAIVAANVHFRYISGIFLVNLQKAIANFPFSNRLPNGGASMKDVFNGRDIPLYLHFAAASCQ
jgi:P27 family predicted phage terminase small subunit